MNVSQRVELGEHLRSRVGGGARRRDADEHPVQLVMLADDGLVEAFDERAAVVAGGQDAVVLELDHGFLDRTRLRPSSWATSLRSTRSPERSFPVSTRLMM